MILRNQQNILQTWKKSNSYGNTMSKFLPTSEFKSLDPANFNLDKNDGDSLRGCVVEFDFVIS